MLSLKLQNFKNILSIKRIFFISLFSSLVVSQMGCSSNKLYESFRQRNEYIYNKYDLGIFHKIDISGDINVDINKQARGGPKFSYIGVYASKREQDLIWMNVKEDTLYLKGLSSKAKVNLNLTSYRDIKVINVNNNAILRGEINQNDTPIWIKTSGFAKIDLVGSMNLGKLIQNSVGDVQIRFVCGENVDIQGIGKGLIYLGGTPINVNINLFAFSNLDVRYLRAKNISIVTSDFSTANVFATDNISALSKGNSNIYYYNRYANIRKISQNNSRILFME